jgi:hypothetical protein
MPPFGEIYSNGFLSNTRSSLSSSFSRSPSYGIDGSVEGRGQRGEGRGETETRDTRHETRDTRHETRDTRHETRDTRHETRDPRHETRDTRHETRDTRHETRDTRHETVLPQSMLPCLWSSLLLELRFHDHLDVGLVGTVDLLSIPCRLCHPHPRVIFCCHLGINAISVKFGLITSALYGIRFHEFGPF